MKIPCTQAAPFRFWEQRYGKPDYTPNKNDFTIKFKITNILRYASPSGLLLTLVVHVVYRVALHFER